MAKLSVPNIDALGPLSVARLDMAVGGFAPAGPRAPASLATTFGEGQFVMSAEIDGATRQIRVTDQVHFTEIGYDLVAGLLRADVERLFLARSAAQTLDAMTLQ